MPRIIQGATADVGGAGTGIAAGFNEAREIREQDARLDQAARRINLAEQQVQIRAQQEEQAHALQREKFEFERDEMTRGFDASSEVGMQMAERFPEQAEAILRMNPVGPYGTWRNSDQDLYTRTLYDDEERGIGERLVSRIERHYTAAGEGGGGGEEGVPLFEEGEARQFLDDGMTPARLSRTLADRAKAEAERRKSLELGTGRLEGMRTKVKEMESMGSDSEHIDAAMSLIAAYEVANDGEMSPEQHKSFSKSWARLTAHPDLREEFEELDMLRAQNHAELEAARQAMIEMGAESNPQKRGMVTERPPEEGGLNPIQFPDTGPELTAAPDVDGFKRALKGQAERIRKLGSREQRAAVAKLAEKFNLSPEQLEGLVSGDSGSE